MDYTFSTADQINYTVQLDAQPHDRYLHRLVIFTARPDHIDVSLQVFLDDTERNVEAILYDQVDPLTVYVTYFNDYHLPANQSHTIRLKLREHIPITAVTCEVTDRRSDFRTIEWNYKSANPLVGAFGDGTTEPTHLFEAHFAVQVDSAAIHLLPNKITAGGLTWQKKLIIKLKYGDYACIYRQAAESVGLNVTNTKIELTDPAAATESIRWISKIKVKLYRLATGPVPASAN